MVALIIYMQICAFPYTMSLCMTLSPWYYRDQNLLTNCKPMKISTLSKVPEFDLQYISCCKQGYRTLTVLGILNGPN